MVCIPYSRMLLLGIKYNLFEQDNETSKRKNEGHYYINAELRIQNAELKGKTEKRLSLFCFIY